MEDPSLSTGALDDIIRSAVSNDKDLDLFDDLEVDKTKKKSETAPKGTKSKQTPIKRKSPNEKPGKLPKAKISKFFTTPLKKAKSKK
jgi:hypothetical protein